MPRSRSPGYHRPFMGMFTHLRTIVGLALAAALLTAGCSGAAPAATTTTTGSNGPVTSSVTEPVPTSSTTTTAVTTTTIVEEPGRGSGVIGIVGCSNSAIAAAGYDEVSDRDYLTQGSLTGGSVEVWANTRVARYDRYWGMYDERRPADGYTGTWLQLCIRTSEHRGSFNDDIKGWIEHIVGQIQERDPGIPIWISPVNTFADDVICDTIGKEGPAIAAEAADWAADNVPGVERGPDLGPINESQMDPTSECHPSRDGSLVLGEQLVEFFD